MDTYNPGDFIGDEVGRMISIRTFQKEIIPKTPGKNSEHQVSASLHIYVATGPTPHLERICKECIFRGRFFIFSIGRREKAFGPGMAMIPIECPEYREFRILLTRICCLSSRSQPNTRHQTESIWYPYVSDQHIDPVTIGS